MKRELIDAREPGSLRAISELAAAIWPHCYGHILTPGQIDYMLAEMYSETQMLQDIREGIIFRLLRVNDQPAGFISFGPYDHTTIKVHKLYLRPEYHRHGLGRFMMDDAAAYGREHGYHHLTLNVNRHNESSIKFYLRYGYTIAEEKKLDIGNGFFMDDYIMRYAL